VKRARADAGRLPFWQLLALRSQGLPNGDWWERVGAEFNLLTARGPARYWRPYKRHKLALWGQAARRGMTPAAMKAEVCAAAFDHVCSDTVLLGARTYPIRALQRAADRFTGTADGAPRVRRQRPRPKLLALDAAEQAGLLPVVRPGVLEHLIAAADRAARFAQLDAISRPGTRERQLVELLRADTGITVPEAAQALGVEAGTVRVMAWRLKQKAAARRL